MTIDEKLLQIEEKLGISEKKKDDNVNITITTGDPYLNDAKFNGELDSTDNTDNCGVSSLEEATKRYIKRYYIRPQNVFCSSKSDIIKALAKIGQSDCSIYSLTSLKDHDDVHKLTNNDIIYYYDDGVLYDKNHVQIFDYELRPKDEEKREEAEKESKDGSSSETKELRDIYFDDKRVTAVTANKDNTIKVKENLEENPFKLDFDSINALGENLTESKKPICAICGEELTDIDLKAANKTDDGKKICKSCFIKFIEPFEETNPLTEALQTIDVADLLKEPQKLDPSKRIIDRTVRSWLMQQKYHGQQDWNYLPVRISLSVGKGKSKTGKAFNPNPNPDVCEAFQMALVCLLLKYYEILSPSFLFKTLEIYGIKNPGAVIKQIYKDYWSKNYTKYAKEVEDSIQSCTKELTTKGLL